MLDDVNDETEESSQEVAAPKKQSFAAMPVMDRSFYDNPIPSLKRDFYDNPIPYLQKRKAEQEAAIGLQIADVNRQNEEFRRSYQERYQYHLKNAEKEAAAANTVATPNVPPAWVQITKSPDWQTLTTDQQEAKRTSYRDNDLPKILPVGASPKDIEKAKSAFDSVAPKIAQPKSTFGQNIADSAVSLMGGFAALGKNIGDLYGLAAGDGENWLAEAGDNATKYWDSLKSDSLKAKESDRSKRVAQANGDIWGEIKAAGGDTISDPALLSSLLVANIPNIIPGMAVGRGVAAARLAQGLATAGKLGQAGELAAIQAAEKSAVAYGTAASVGTGALLQGADVGGEAYDIAKAFLDKNRPDLTNQERKDTALQTARKAALTGAIISVGTNAFPGAHSFEKSLIGKQTGKGGLRGAGVRALGEGTGEVFEEGGGKFGANYFQRNDLDPTQSLTQGVGTNAVLGGIGGAGLGGISGLRGEHAKTNTTTTSGTSETTTAGTANTTNANDGQSSASNNPSNGTTTGSGGTDGNVSLSPQEAALRSQNLGGAESGTTVPTVAGSDTSGLGGTGDTTGQHRGVPGESPQGSTRSLVSAVVDKWAADRPQMDKVSRETEAEDLKEYLQNAIDAGQLNALVEDSKSPNPQFGEWSRLAAQIAEAQAAQKSTNKQDIPPSNPVDHNALPPTTVAETQQNAAPVNPVDGNVVPPTTGSQDPNRYIGGEDGNTPNSTTINRLLDNEKSVTLPKLQNIADEHTKSYELYLKDNQDKSKPDVDKFKAATLANLIERASERGINGAKETEQQAIKLGIRLPKFEGKESKFYAAQTALKESPPTAVKAIHTSLANASESVSPVASSNVGGVQEKSVAQQKVSKQASPQANLQGDSSVQSDSLADSKPEAGTKVVDLKKAESQSTTAPIANVPKLFLMNHKVEARVYNDLTNEYEQEHIAADEALLANQHDIETFEALKKCVGGS